MLTDFDPEVRAVASQPFWLCWRDEDDRSRRTSSSAGLTGAPWSSTSVPMTGSRNGTRRRLRVLPVLFHLMWQRQLAADLAVPLSTSAVVHTGGTP